MAPEQIDFEISTAENGLRLDVVLAARLEISRSQVARLLAGGNVAVDGLERKPAFKCEEGQHIRVVPKDQAAPADFLTARAIPLDILYEDESILIVDKPAGMVVHPGAGNYDMTLVNALMAHCPHIEGVGERQRPGIVHRLDKLTSGVMVVAKTQKAHAVLAQDFKSHAHLREYQAVCFGHMPQESGRIETFFNRHPKDRKRMSSRVVSGRKAITNWEVEKTWAGFSLLRLRLETGRTHQIRVHLADLNHPVVGDAIYGGCKRAANIADRDLREYVRQIDRQMLHACRLGITHPLTGEEMVFSSDVPPDMRSLIERLSQA